MIIIFIDFSDTNRRHGSVVRPEANPVAVTYYIHVPHAGGPLFVPTCQLRGSITLNRQRQREYIVLGSFRACGIGVWSWYLRSATRFFWKRSLMPSCSRFVTFAPTNGGNQRKSKNQSCSDAPRPQPERRTSHSRNWLRICSHQP